MHVYVTAISHLKPRLTPYAEADSPPLDEDTMIAIMSNYERLRLLWLNNKVVESTALFAGYSGTTFTEKYSHTLPQMLRENPGASFIFGLTWLEPWEFYKGFTMLRTWVDKAVKTNGQRAQEPGR